MDNYAIFGLERLEDRTLLAVNVTQHGGTLTITGDDFDNAVSLFNDSGGIHVRVDEDGDGVPDFDEIYYGVTNIKVNLKGGDDEIGVFGIDIPGSLTINTGTGDDLLLITYEGDFNDIGGNLAVTTGDGDDAVVIAGAYVDRKVTIDTGNGEDYVALGDNGYFYSDIYSVGGYSEGYFGVGGSTTINTGNHNDEVRIQPYGGDYEVEFGALTINTGAGDDDVYLGADVDYDLHVHGNFSLQLGAGDDFVEVQNEYYQTRFYGKVVINAGGGFDEIYNLEEWFDYADDTFELGLGAVKFVKFEVFSD